MEVFLHLVCRVFQVCITLSVNKFFILSKLNLPSLSPFLLVLPPATTEQSHRISSVGRSIWRLSSPAIWCDLLQQGLTTTLYLVAQDLIHLSFEYLQGWRLQHNSDKAPEQDFSHSRGEEVLFPYVQLEFSMSQLLSPATCPLVCLQKGHGSVFSLMLL